MTHIVLDSDGTIGGTSCTINGKVLEDCISLHYDIDAAAGAKLTIVVDNAPLHLDAELTERVFTSEET